MMREIFHLEKFELYRKTVVLEGKVKMEMAQTNSLINQFDSITDEVIQAKTEAVEQARKELESLEKQLKESETAFQKLEQLKSLFEELKEQKEILDRLEEQVPKMKSKEEHLQAYEQCLLNFKPLLDRKKELLEEQQKLEIQNKQKTVSYTHLTLPTNGCV